MWRLYSWQPIFTTCLVTEICSPRVNLACRHWHYTNENYQQLMRDSDDVSPKTRAEGNSKGHMVMTSNSFHMSLWLTVPVHHPCIHTYWHMLKKRTNMQKEVYLKKPRTYCLLSACSLFPQHAVPASFYAGLSLSSAHMLTVSDVISCNIWSQIY